MLHGGRAQILDIIPAWTDTPMTATSIFYLKSTIYKSETKICLEEPKKSTINWHLHPETLYCKILTLFEIMTWNLGNLKFNFNMY